MNLAIATTNVSIYDELGVRHIMTPYTEILNRSLSTIKLNIVNPSSLHVIDKHTFPRCN
jgi:hypothetical protein